MLGRHNITIYGDELERAIGGLSTYLANADVSETEAAYWLGARNALAALHGYDLPDSWQALMAALKLRFDGGDGAAVVNETKAMLEEGKTDA